MFHTLLKSWFILWAHWSRAPYATAICIIVILGYINEIVESSDIVPSMLLKEAACSGAWRLTAGGPSRLLNEGNCLEVRFDSGGGTLYNPTLSPLIRRPATLVVYDARGNRVGDLFSRLSAARRTPDAGDWISIPTGGFVGRSFIFSRHDFVNLFAANGQSLESSDRIYIQLLASASLTCDAMLPDDSEGERNSKYSFWKNGFEKIVSASNIVELEVVAPPIK